MTVISTYNINDLHQTIEVNATYDYKPTVDEYAPAYSFLNCIYRNSPRTVLHRINNDLQSLIHRKYAFYISKATANVSHNDTSWQASIHLNWCVLTMQQCYDVAWDIEYFLTAIVSPFIQISQPDQVNKVLIDLVSGAVSLRDVLACSTIAVGIRSDFDAEYTWEYYFPTLPDTHQEKNLKYLNQHLVKVKNRQDVAIRFYVNDTKTDPHMSFQSFVHSYMNMFLNGDVLSMIRNLPYASGNEELIPITVTANRTTTTTEA